MSTAAGGGGAHALPPGARVQEYEVQRVLGGGGFGLTYLARDAHLDLPVALKEFFPAEIARREDAGAVVPWSADAETQHAYRAGLARFLEEARTLAAFRHAHIVRVLRYFQAHGTAYIVMEYEIGLPLRRWMPRHSPLGREALLGVVLPLLDGLEAVHAAGFLHRDIKPDNIIVRPGGSPVLLDFGAAGRVNAAPVHSGIVSPGFAAPEQYDGFVNQGPWTDVYSIGAVMYWMACGRTPADAPMRRLRDTLLPAARCAPAEVFGLPLLAVIDRALRTAPQERPQSVAELRAALAALPATGRRPDTTVTLPGPAAPLRTTAQADPIPAGLQQRDVLCSVLFLDLVGQSLRPVDQQVSVKHHLDSLIARAVEGVPPDSRLTIDTGDGAALCFLGQAQDALQTALRLQALLSSRQVASLQVRIGLHIGPVRVVSDINRRTNVIGDAINMARRIMDFAQGHQALVSRAFRDVIARAGQDRPGLFRYAGLHVDKHGRIHEVHEVREFRRIGTLAAHSACASERGGSGPGAGLQWLDSAARQGNSGPARFRLADDTSRRHSGAPAPRAQAQLSSAPGDRPRW